MSYAIHFFTLIISHEVLNRFLTNNSKRLSNYQKILRFHYEQIVNYFQDCFIN